MAGRPNLLPLDEFLRRFGTDERCRQALFDARWPDGFRCPHCGAERAYVLRGRPLYECAACGHQTSVTADTVLHGSHVPLRKWFLTAYLDAESKRGISATELYQKIGVRFPTAWFMLHRLRSAMGERDANHMLEGVIEIDDAYFGGPVEGRVGRGTEKPKALVAMSVDTLGNPEYLKIRIVPDFTQQTTNAATAGIVTQGATIRSDGLSAFGALSEAGFVHDPVPSNRLPDGVQPFPYLHTQISNAKAWIAGTFHGLGSQHLQAYLDEFCFRFNRRRMRSGVLERLLVAVGQSKRLPYRVLVGRHAPA